MVWHGQDSVFITSQMPRKCCIGLDMLHNFKVEKESYLCMCVYTARIPQFWKYECDSSVYLRSTSKRKYLEVVCTRSAHPANGMQCDGEGISDM